MKIIALSFLIFLSLHSFAMETVPLKEGLSLHKIEFKSTKGNERLSFLKINPKKFKFKLISYKRDGDKQSTKKEQDTFPENIKLRKYLKKFSYLAVINSSMFLKDYSTSVGYMRDFNFINNPIHNQKYSGALVFNPKLATLPAVDVIDKVENPKWLDDIKNYETVIENFRTIVAGKNIWKPSSKKFTHMFQLAIGKDGDVYFIGFESEIGRTIAGFNDLILAQKFAIEDAVYLDGGPHGILQVETAKHKEEFGAAFKVFSPNFILIQDI